MSCKLKVWRCAPTSADLSRAAMLCLRQTPSKKVKPEARRKIQFFFFLFFSCQKRETRASVL